MNNMTNAATKKSVLRRVGRAMFGPLLLIALGTSCMTLQPPTLIQTVSDISGDLVGVAETRVNVAAMRLWVEEIHRTDASTVTGAFGATHHGSDSLGLILEHEFVVALARRVNLVDKEAADMPDTATLNPTLAERAEFYEATHVLVGDYIVQGGDVMVSVRLVDAKTRLIVAAASGVLIGAAEELDSEEEGADEDHEESEELVAQD